MNSQNPNIRYTETPDRTVDMGPVKRADTPVWFFTIVFGVAAIALTTIGVHAIPALSWIPAVVLGLPCAYGIWSIQASYRDRVDAPKSHNMLAGELGFDLLGTCQGVVATPFFVPDTLGRSGTSALYLFLENYMSRHRVVHVRFGHLPCIGRPKATHETFHLAAGQAAVYTMPVRAKPDIATGFHRLSVQITVEQPTGVGQKLVGTRVHIHNMRKLRFAAPFELAAGRPETTGNQPELPKPRYISLASISEKDPNIERLHDLAGTV